MGGSNHIDDVEGAAALPWVNSKTLSKPLRTQLMNPPEGSQRPGYHHPLTTTHPPFPGELARVLTVTLLLPSLCILSSARPSSLLYTMNDLSHLDIIKTSAKMKMKRSHNH
jgi:hypothetical protein